jgi:hypothetical protein
VRQKDNVRRYLGYGTIEEGLVLSCAEDRATLWAVGNLARDQSHNFSVPLPVAMSGKAVPHEFSATLCWFAPPKVGSAKYRGGRLKLLDPEEISLLGIGASKNQPDINQSHRGTVVHRRWLGSKAAALSDEGSLSLIIQREPDEFDDLIPYALVTTIEMSGVSEIYAQVSAKVSIKPKVQVQT